MPRNLKHVSHHVVLPSSNRSFLSAQGSRFINDNGWDDLHKRQSLELAHAEKGPGSCSLYMSRLYMSRSEGQLWNRPLHSTEAEESYSEDGVHWVAERRMLQVVFHLL